MWRQGRPDQRQSSHLPDKTASLQQRPGDLIPDLYWRMPDARITENLPDVDKATGFTDAFTHLRTGAPCKDRIGLLNVILAEGLNPGLGKMAEATNTHEYFELSRLSRRHVESDAINQTLSMVVEAQSQPPMAHTGVQA